jgi:hypothetical protein
LASQLVAAVQAGDQEQIPVEPVVVEMPFQVQLLLLTRELQEL